MFVSSISYTLPVDGSATESVTLVGNNKQWIKGIANTATTAADVVDFSGSDEPLAKGADNSPSGGISQREDVMLSGCILPGSIQGINGTGYANGLNTATKIPRVHIQNVFS